MKRYQIAYMNSKSQVETHTTYCIGKSDLNATLVDLIVEGNFIDWVGEKDELDTIGRYQEIRFRPLLKELNVLDKNNSNEDKAYKEWGL